MAQCIANPIYDAAFKFLMEDDRCVKILLSALLQKEVVSVKVRPHEYTEKKEKRISIYRVDFGATIREKDGSEHLIVIELQKTWRPTEILRFRKYLGMQYEDKRNVSDETGIPVPIVSIYILGHTIGDLEEPVVYVKRRYLDYDSNEITTGVPCTFVESLTHDSIVVQIPYLSDKIRNHLDLILDVFNQKYISAQSDYLIEIGTRDISDSDLLCIVNRLAFAAADPEVRYAMNVEEEVIGELEGLDTKVLLAKQKLTEQAEQIAEQSNQIAEQSNQIAEQSNQIAEQSNQIAEQSNQIAEQSNQIAEQSNQIAEQSNQIAEQSNQIAEQSNIIMASAKAMKQAGMPINQIASLTNLTEYEIANL